MKRENDAGSQPENAGARQTLSPQAERALDEARQRRRTAIEEARAKEVDGRGGLEPVRFGDWEVKGLATDF